MLADCAVIAVNAGCLVVTHTAWLTAGSLIVNARSLVVMHTAWLTAGSLIVNARSLVVMLTAGSLRVDYNTDCFTSVLSALALTNLTLCCFLFLWSWQS